MATKRSAAWPFDRKFRQWRADHKVSIDAFRKRVGIPYATFHGWVEGGVRVPATGMALIAAATGLPAEYWTNEAVPYPPPAEYLDLSAEVEKAVKGLDVQQLQQVLDMLRSPADLGQTLELRRVARKPSPS